MCGMRYAEKFLLKFFYSALLHAPRKDNQKIDTHGRKQREH